MGIIFIMSVKSSTWRARLENKINFCNWGLATLQEDPLFFSAALPTDESTFRNNGNADGIRIF